MRSVWLLVNYYIQQEQRSKNVQKSQKVGRKMCKKQPKVVQ